MLRSGLVSLNVHEPLTFEGTEICLHPDILIVQQQQQQQTSSSSTTALYPHHGGVILSGSSVLSNSSSGVAEPAQQQQQQQTTSSRSIWSPSSSPVVAKQQVLSNQQYHHHHHHHYHDQQLLLHHNKHQQQHHHHHQQPTATTTSTAATGTSNSNSILQVGSMIEIRVWDALSPLSTTAATTSNSNMSSPIAPIPRTPASSATTAIARKRPSASTMLMSAAASAGGNGNGAAHTASGIGIGGGSVVQQSKSTNSVSSATSDRSSSAPPAAAPAITSAAAMGSSSCSSSLDLPMTTTTTTTSVPNSSTNTAIIPGTTASRPTGASASVTTTASTTTTPTEHHGGGGGDGSDEGPSGAEIVGCNTSTSSGTRSRTDVVVVDSHAKSGGLDVADISTVSSSDERSTPRNTNSVCYPPTKSIITNSTGVLPPVFPRSTTTSTSTRHPNLIPPPPPPPPPLQTQTTTTTSKPPIQRRPSSGMSPENEKHHHQQQHMTPSSTSTRGFNNTTRKPVHVRDLSDVTADVVLQGPPPMASTSGETAICSDHEYHDEDEDDDYEDSEEMWMRDMLTTHSLRLAFVMKLSEKSLTSLKGSARTQVSLLRPVADLYQLSSYDTVTIHAVPKCYEEAVLENVSADFVLVTIKDQFISRGDMHFFQQNLIGSWIYEGQRLSETTRGVVARAREIRNGNEMVRSGIITDKTTVTFRSRSARIIWLVQISAEMWDYASPYEASNPNEGQMNNDDDDSTNDESMCEIYFDKWINFIRQLFQKWKALEATHSLTVVFFSRTSIGTGSWSSSMTEDEPPSCPAEQKDPYGRRYQDHFRIVVENVTTDWESLVARIKEAFVRYPSEVGWNLSTGPSARRPSTASQGNVLEAINVTLNLLQYHYLDRDLHRTGNSLVVISPGNGVFEVDKQLASITYQRMMDNGIGSDMLSLGLPPLHIAPFFLYINDSVETEGSSSSGETYYEVPHWMHLSFVAYESDSSVLSENHVPSKEDTTTTGQAPVEIGPNGFIIHRASTQKMPSVEAASSPMLRPNPAIPASGMSSPRRNAKQHRQARKLIAGRNFRDILEACRPRHAGVIPSALKALLRTHERQPSGDYPKGSVTGKAEYHQKMQEWGTLDFDMQSAPEGRSRRRTMSVGQELNEGQRLASPHSPSAIDEVDRSECGSHASSFASQVSNSMLGALHDRPLMSSQPSSFSKVYLQRPPSIDGLSFLGHSSAEETDGGVKRTVDGKDDKNSGTKATESFIETMRSIMRAHDAQALLNHSPKITAKTETVRTLSGSRQAVGISPTGNPVPTSLAGVSVHQPTLVGGIGAALSQYRPTATSGSADHSGEAVGTPKVASAGRIPVRAGIGLSYVRQISDMGSRGMSPLLLPPVAASMAEMPEAFRREEVSASVRRALEQRLVDVQDASRNVLRSKGVDLQDASRSVSRSKGVDAQTRLRMTSRDGGIASSPPTAGGRFVSSTHRRDANNSSKNANSNNKPNTSKPLKVQGRQSHRGGGKGSTGGSRRKKAFNPFRQEAEEEVLAQKSHNRRRWSHVFPLGEVEFKRHAGPNWKSLTAPAILPLSIDYFPPQQEIDQYFTFSIYNVTLNEFDTSASTANFQSNEDLLVEMVRQRLTQDYQLVPPSHVNASNYRRESLRDGLASRGRSASISDDSCETTRWFLSMGHRLVVLTYDSNADHIEVIRYNAKSAQQNSTFKYKYMCYCQETQSFTHVGLMFLKYSDLYNWNQVDRIISSVDADRELREGMRFRRIMFCLIPERFKDASAEQEYVSRFSRLLEYMNKLRATDDASNTTLDIKVVTRADMSRAHSGRCGGGLESRPGISRTAMKNFYVHLRKGKGKRDPREWMEVVVDSTFNTTWTYRIMFHWLVASSGKVDKEVQLLQRRCTQYGLNLVPFPQITVSKNCFLYTFKAPTIFPLRFKHEESVLVNHLKDDADFIHDGVFYTDMRLILECIEDGPSFDFGYSSPGRQFVHRSGTIIVRILVDKKDWAIIVVFGNYRYMAKDEILRTKSQDVFRDLVRCIDKVKNVMAAPKQKDQKPEPPEAQVQTDLVSKPAAVSTTKRLSTFNSI